MHSIILRALICSLLLALSAAAQSAAPSPNVELTAVLQELSESATPEQVRQISDAIAASPTLIEQLNSLAASRRITQIRVAPPEAIRSVRGVRFGASLNGTQLVLAVNLLTELLKDRLIDVVKPNDVSPNNTTFVIGHLAFHAKTADEMAKVESDMKRMVVERSKEAGRHDYTDILQLGQRAWMEYEASAFIQGWNYVVDAATQANGGKTLSAEQVSSLLLNLRYRFAFMKALQIREVGIQISNTGMIQMNERNIKAIAEALRISPMADVQ